MRLKHSAVVDKTLRDHGALKDQTSSLLEQAKIDRLQPVSERAQCCEIEFIGPLRVIVAEEFQLRRLNDGQHRRLGRHRSQIDFVRVRPAERIELVIPRKVIENLVGVTAPPSEHWNAIEKAAVENQAARTHETERR